MQIQAKRFRKKWCWWERSLMLMREVSGEWLNSPPKMTGRLHSLQLWGEEDHIRSQSCQPKRGKRGWLCVQAHQTGGLKIGKTFPHVFLIMPLDCCVWKSLKYSNNLSGTNNQYMVKVTEITFFVILTGSWPASAKFYALHWCHMIGCQIQYQSSSSDQSQPW